MVGTIKRRTLFSGIAAYSLVSMVNTAHAQHADDFLAQAMPEGSSADFDGSLDSIQNFGTNPAKPEEETRAREIMRHAAETVGSFSVANFLLSLTGEEERYKGGWPDRWNPLIRDFFLDTGTQPRGDVTPWCAAFINWCLKSNGLAYVPNAASGSFRNWARATDNPVPGDIVVFMSSDPAEAALLKGHVGFFVASQLEAIRVLGGNQITRAGHHEISSVWFRRNSPSLTFHSYRTGFRGS